MDINKIFDLMEKNNINQEQIFDLAQEAKNIDLSDDEAIRELIRKGGKLANKPIDSYKEQQMIDLIKEKGITPELLDLL